MTKDEKMVEAAYASLGEVVRRSDEARALLGELAAVVKDLDALFLKLDVVRAAQEGLRDRYIQLQRDLRDAISGPDRIAPLQTAVARLRQLQQQECEEIRDLPLFTAKRSSQSLAELHAPEAPAPASVPKAPRVILRVDLSEQSTWIDEVVYCPQDATLTVHVHREGASYAHHNVPRAVFDALITSKSPGRYYNSRLRGQSEKKAPVIREETEEG